MLHALRDYSLPLLLALALHGAAVWALYAGWHPERELAMVVKPKMVMANLLVLEPKATPKPPPPAPEPQASPPQPAAEPRPEPQVAQRDKAEEEAARKAAEEARRQREREQRLAELARLAEADFEQAIDEESANLQAGTEDMVAQSYQARMYDAIWRNWSRPPSARTGMSVRLLVELIPTGEVVSVTVVESSGNGAFDRSAEQAVRRVGRFEVPQENAIFERHFRRVDLLFQPGDLLR